MPSEPNKEEKEEFYREVEIEKAKNVLHKNGYLITTPEDFSILRKYEIDVQKMIFDAIFK